MNQQKTILTKNEERGELLRKKAELLKQCKIWELKLKAFEEQKQQITDLTLDLNAIEEQTANLSLKLNDLEEQNQQNLNLPLKVEIDTIKDQITNLTLKSDDVNEKIQVLLGPN